jgi:hypothetical protein
MAQVSALSDSEPRPDTKEIEIAHCVLKALGAYWAARTQNPSARQILHVPREERAGLALAGRLLNPLQPVRSPDADASVRMLNDAASCPQATASTSERIG